MKKRSLLKYVTLSILLSILMPSMVFATENSESDAVIDNEESQYNPICNEECDYSGVLRSSSAGGVRFTFIDSDGKPITGSYDFTTSIHKSHITIYNKKSGDKSKLSGTFEKGEAKVADLPKLSSLISYYNQYAYNKSTLPTTGNTGANISTGWARESEWFRSLTSRDNAYAVADLNGFIRALHDVYPDFDANKMILKISEACQKGQEIFLIMEPVFYYAISDTIHFLGTIRDYVKFYGVLPPNLDTTIYQVYYDRHIDATNFTGFEPVASGEYQLQSIEDINSRVGYAVGLDWVTDPGSSCSQCRYDNVMGRIYYNDKLISQPVAPFKTLEEYALSNAKEALKCCSQLSPYEATMHPRWKDAYKKYCKQDTGNDICEIVTKEGQTKYYCKEKDSNNNAKECTKEEYENVCLSCCNEKVKEPVVNINNCCDDNTHSYIKEPELNELFCNDGTNGVDDNIPKCEADKYKDTDTKFNQELNGYCEMYCSEELSVDLPGAITAVSGRYFELAPTKRNGTILTYTENNQNYNINSPYIEGTRNCRVVIKYNKWKEDYDKNIAAQVEKNNAYQEAEAIKKVYAAVEATAEDKKDTNAKVKFTASCKDGDEELTDTKEETCTVKYKRALANKTQKYYLSKLTSNKLGITNDKSATAKINTTFTDYITYAIDQSACENIVGGTTTLKKTKKVDGKDKEFSCEATWTRESITSNADHVYANFEKDRDSAISNAATALSNFTNTVTEGNKLKDNIDTCGNYFTKYDGADSEKTYKLKPSMKFKYSQIYLNEEGKQKMAMNDVDWSDVICNHDTVKSDFDPKYSTKYGDGSISIRDFDLSKIGFQTSTTLPLNETLSVSKKFSQDARYHATCYWKELENQVNTLVPSGAATETTSKMNFTKHERKYYVYLTTFDGTYETYWNLSNIGNRLSTETAGRFDKYFGESKNKTCSNRPANNGDGNMSCKLHTEFEIVLTGRCNGSNGTDVTIETDDCDKQKEGVNLFNFRIVDPENIFPSGTKVIENNVEKEIAHNWRKPVKKEDNSIEWVWVNAKKEIEQRAAKDETFNQKYLSYSFILTPTDMGHIKNYNASRIEDGGYSDFVMNCNCDPNNDGVNEGPCIQCKSDFITKLANGNVKYDGVPHNVSGWANPNDSLPKVRNKNRW